MPVLRSLGRVSLIAAIVLPFPALAVLLTVRSGLLGLWPWVVVLFIYCVAVQTVAGFVRDVLALHLCVVAAATALPVLLLTPLLAGGLPEWGGLLLVAAAGFAASLYPAKHDALQGVAALTAVHLMWVAPVVVMFYTVTYVAQGAAFMLLIVVFVGCVAACRISRDIV